MRQLQEIAPSGLNRDLAPWAAPDEWHRAEQIVFRRGYAQTIGRKVNIWNNWDGAGVDLDGPDFLLNYYDGTLSYWLYGCADGVGVTDGASHKTITPGTFTTPLASDAWTGGLLGGVPFLNYGTDPACYWGLDFATPTVMAAMADAPECAAMRPYRSVLVALDTSANTNNGSIDASEEVVAWSKANDAGSVPSAAGDWTPANSNIAGFAPLGPDGGLCIDGLQFRDSFLIGKNNGFWVMDLVGGNEVMAFRRLFQTGGVLARNCMAEVDGNVFVLTDSDIVVTDGNDVRSVVDRRLRQTIFDDLGENFARSWLAYNKQQREVWVAPVRTGEEYAHGVYIYDLDTDKWGYFEPDDGTYDLTHASPGRDSSASNDTYATTTETYDSIDQRYNETVGGQVADVLFWANVGGQVCIFRDAR